MANFASRLYQLRKESHLTQQELADKLNMTRASVSAYEKEKINVPSDKVQFLANYFNVSLDYMMGKSDDRTDSKTSSTTPDTPTTDSVMDIAEVLDSLVLTLEDYDVEIQFDGVELDSALRSMLSKRLQSYSQAIKTLQNE